MIGRPLLLLEDDTGQITGNRCGNADTRDTSSDDGNVHRDFVAHGPLHITGCSNPAGRHQCHGGAEKQMPIDWLRGYVDIHL